jgi:hypothetical protein
MYYMGSVSHHPEGKEKAIQLHTPSNMKIMTDSYKNKANSEMLGEGNFEDYAVVITEGSGPR